MTAEDRLDEFADYVEQPARRQPGSQPAIEAAELSVAMAQRLTFASPTVDNALRLARAHWCQTHAHFMAADFVKAAECAQYGWMVCLELLNATAADTAAFDEVTGCVIRWCGVFGPAVAKAGPQQEADRMEEVCRDIATRALGPRGRQARARQAMGDLFHTLNPAREAVT